jgi:hypothetical protein
VAGFLAGLLAWELTGSIVIGLITAALVVSLSDFSDEPPWVLWWSKWVRTRGGS